MKLKSVKFSLEVLVSYLELKRKETENMKYNQSINEH